MMTWFVGGSIMQYFQDIKGEAMMVMVVVMVVGRRRGRKEKEEEGRRRRAEERWSRMEGCGGESETASGASLQLHLGGSLSLSLLSPPYLLITAKS